MNRTWGGTQRAVTRKLDLPCEGWQDSNGAWMKWSWRHDHLCRPNGSSCCVTEDNLYNNTLSTPWKLRGDHSDCYHFLCRNSFLFNAPRQQTLPVSGGKTDRHEEGRSTRKPVLVFSYQVFGDLSLQGCDAILGGGWIPWVVCVRCKTLITQETAHMNIHTLVTTLYDVENDSRLLWTTQGGSWWVSTIRRLGKNLQKKTETPKNHVTEDQPVGPVHL